MKKEYEVVVNERDILGTQLIRRNDELALLYEKVKIQQSTLLKGQVQYRDRVNEIRVLKLKLADLKREVGVLRGSVQNIGEEQEIGAPLHHHAVPSGVLTRCLGVLLLTRSVHRVATPGIGPHSSSAP